jgi:hypothetical protein
MSLTAYGWTHVQTMLLMLCLIGKVSAFQSWPSAIRLIIVAFALGMTWLPIGALDLTARILPYSGFLSLASLWLLASCAIHNLAQKSLLSERDRSLFMASVAILGLTLYPTALGLGQYDLYALGFSGIVLPIGLSSVALLVWHTMHRTLALLLLATLWAWLLNMGESQNLWDYLIDPWIVLYGLWSTIHYFIDCHPSAE